MLRILSPGSNFGARARPRTVACRAVVPLVERLAAPDAYRQAAAHARSSGNRLATVGEIDPRGLTLLREHAPGTPLDVVVPPEVASYFDAHDPAAHAWPCDLGRERDLAVWAARVDGSGPVTALVPYALERLPDPRPLLRTLRHRLCADPRSRVFLVAADRERVHELGYAGPPCEPTRLREWTTAELRALLGAAGFALEHEEAIGGSVLFVLAFDRAVYAAQLSRLGLPPPGIQYLLVATEHSACVTTGGIGAYCAQMERAYPREQIGFLLLGSPDALVGARSSVRWLFASELTGDVGLEPAQLTAEVLPSVALLYPELRTVEGHDYLGVTAVAAQARRGGLLPEWLRFKVRCHGTQPYLEQCFGGWRELALLPTTYVEKVGLELADEVSFLSRYLERLYDEQGYRIDPARRRLEPYPFDFSRARLAPAYGPADTLLFFGKRTEMKGFPLFLSSVKRLADDGRLGPIRRIVILGRVEAREREPAELLAQLRVQLAVEERSGSNAEVLRILADEAPRAIVVLPYVADNFPISVPEAVTAGCQIVAARAGGIPEMVPDELHDDVLHDLEVGSLADALHRAIVLDGPARRERVARLQAAMGRRFGPVRLDEAPRSPRFEPGARSTVGVIIPCWETPPGWLDELFAALAQQSLPADEVCLVDDGSSRAWSLALERKVAAVTTLPLTLRRHEHNRGLPAARNTGLAALGTDYVVNVDADDVPRPDFLRRYVDYLDADRDAVAVTSWLERFVDGEDFTDGESCELIYRPLGDGLVMALTENCLGHANSAFRRAALVELGGWDEQDRSMWEDYALFARILSLGGRVGVVPRSEILYRVHATSMVRTQRQFAAQQRLGRNVRALPLFDALRLEGVMRVSKEQLAGLQQKLDEARTPAGAFQAVTARVLGWRR